LEEQIAHKDNVIAELEGRNSSLAMQVADAMQSTSRLMEIVKGKEEQSAVASQSIRVRALSLCASLFIVAGRKARGSRQRLLSWARRTLRSRFNWTRRSEI